MYLVTDNTSRDNEKHSAHRNNKYKDPILACNKSIQKLRVPLGSHYSLKQTIKELFSILLSAFLVSRAVESARRSETVITHKLLRANCNLN